MRKDILTTTLTGILTISMGMTALAGWEQEGTNWKYNDNGTYAANGWKWIDGNNDGIAESYYFDSNGILAKNTTVEGYTVNADGAWVVEGKVQTQSVATNNGNARAADTGNYDPQYPLAGMLDQLGLNFAHHNEMNTDALYWSANYTNWTQGYGSDSLNFNLAKAKAENNLRYLYTPNDYNEMLAIAKLAGRTDINIPYADEAKAEALANNIRKFFELFPNWKSASDYEKACHIAIWIGQADYDENYGGAYNCLVNKKCACSGYWAAANLLAHCVGLEAMMAGDVLNHAYPVFNINGTWLSYDPATRGLKSETFWIYDMYYQSPNEAIYQGKRRTKDDLDKFPNSLARYFYDKGYTVPTRLGNKFDSSIITKVGRYRDHLDFGLYENSGETSSEDALKVKDPCGKLQVGNIYSN